MKLNHSPKPAKKKMYIFSTVVFTVLAVLLFLAWLPVVNPGIWQFLSLVFFIFATHILTKFYLSVYTYVLTDTEFFIFKKTGQREVKVCHVDNFTLVALFSSDEWKIHKKSRQITSVYNYNGEFLSADYSVLVFEINSKRTAVLFEPSDEMREALLKLIRDPIENQ